MTELFVSLRMTPGVNGLYLKQLCGADEISVEDASTKTALSLLEGLITSTNRKTTTDNFNVGKIATADRDRMLAYLYISTYGSKIESTLNCQNCGKSFDLDFSLTDLLDHYRLASNQLPDDGTCQIESGTRFRLPTGEDELMLAEFSAVNPEDFLMTRCFLTGDLENDKIKVQEKMAEIAPVLNVEMQANCPECGYQQQVQFDIQSFLLTRIKQERQQLIREIHSIAINYHWAQDSILNLPRNLRKQYVALIEAES